MAESFAFNIVDKLLGKPKIILLNTTINYQIKINYLYVYTINYQLSTLLVDQVSLAAGVYTELENLKDTISTVKDCFYDAEDVLDEFGYDSLLWQVVNEGGFRRKVRHFFSTSNPLAFRFKMGSKIKGIRERLDKITVDADKFNLKKIMGVPVPVIGPHREREKTYSFVRASDVIGRDGDKDKIIEFMMQSSDDDQENMSVLPLVGIGGLGKTTLAKFVYNDKRVVKHFNKRMWVYVSDELDVTRLIKEIITSATHHKCDDLPIDELQLRLRNELNDNKFLLVLDDVWSKNRDKWLELKAMVDVGAKGSKIIVTTRDKLVANVMGTHPMYELKGLSDEECLSVFIRCAFKDGKDKRYPRLLRIGKDIVKKCQGLPLAVRTLGGLLYLKTNENDWVRVRDSDCWQLEQKKDDILPALKLSYDDLSFDVKQCFALCSLFPKDFQFDNIHLIQMWMGQGLIQPSLQKEEMENIGNQYLDELLQISFFQDVEFHPIGARIFKMHDLVHDLALLVARPNCSTLNFDCKNISTKVRHVSTLEVDWLEEEEEKVPRFFGKLNKNIRTISFPNIVDGPRSESFVGSCILRFKYIRVLDLQKSSFKALPNSICYLKLLKYLDLSDNRQVKRLSNSICKLHHLQTLILVECESLEELPRHIETMMSLRLLIVTTQQIALPPQALGKREVKVGTRCFNSLHNLCLADCNSLESLMGGMGTFTTLTTLIIDGCPCLSLLSKHLLALDTLAIMRCESLDLELGNKNGEKEDDIRGFGSLRNLMLSVLPKLEILPKWLIQGPTSNTLLCLFIERCDNFRALWQDEESPSPNSSVLPEGIDHLIALRQLKIQYCPQLSALPEKMGNLSYLTHLTIMQTRNR